ncbi:putative membrane protein [Lysinibacillus composti]|uniref:DUF1648 domain-containing protein n=1 Tax=Lysinibacillus composti TaxID=720633 RepID=A0A3N9UJY5_9BACI|nr:DUF1648 domain-containing protein [Lysinibacillus composti]MBM7607185.1 putative membrane protein [Lysinibacillus composti]RQW76230.1 DUF1648 domain-containing protein [Lysinibacillus composti]
MKLPYRPIIIFPKTKLEKVADWVGISLFLVAIFYIIIMWGNIPNEVPGHFNSKGEVDRWGTKFEILILPVIGAFLFVLLSLLEKAPHMHNYPKRLNESNVEQFYLASRKMLNMIKNICLLLFTFLTIQIVRVSLGEIYTLGVWFLPIILIIIFGTIIFGIIKQSKIK